MASSFRFGFQTDDIDEDMSDAEEPTTVVSEVHQDQAREQRSRPLLYVETKRHGIDELLATLPSRIFYNTLTIKLPTGDGRQITVPRREVFDANAQLMAEEAEVDQAGNEDLASQLKSFDVRHGFYEGGSKTWESSVDLAGVLVTDYSFLFAENVEEIRVIELGSGPAIPVLAFLKTIFQLPKPSTPLRRRIHFVLSDFNLIFFRLFTAPNVLLTWYISRNPDADPISEVDIDDKLINDFRADMAAYGISFTFISGPWSPEWADMAFPLPKEGEQPLVGKGYTLLFSSETIYSPDSLPDFVQLLVSILDRAADRQHSPDSSNAKYSNPKALIAAKKLYFGLGGGIDSFVSTLKEMAGERASVIEKLDINDQGVMRGVWEVKLKGGSSR
ncbi:hypothetical protein VTO42DRAFT_6641 [Malbranchea cinnamomea]